MRKTIALAILAACTTGAAQAGVMLFEFDAGVGGTAADIGSYTGNGSWFGMNPGFGIIRTNISPTTTGTPGIDMTATEGFTGGGTPPFTMTNIDDAWSFFFNDGIHFTTGALPVVNNGDGTASIDMTNWRVAWGADPAGAPLLVNMGAGAPAVVNWGADGVWDTGDEWLDYSAIVPVGDPSGFGGAPYNLHLEGSFSPVPIPAAAWLFGSAALGLIGLGRRRASQKA